MKPNTAGTAPAFLTVQETRRALEDRRTRNVWRMIADGRLRVHRIGRLVRIALADIVLFEAAELPGSVMHAWHEGFAAFTGVVKPSPPIFNKYTSPQSHKNGQVSAPVITSPFAASQG